MNVNSLQVYKVNDIGVYRGINKKFFPKWEGWDMEDGEERDLAVSRFYETYFFYSLKLDILEDCPLSHVIMEFATLQGKRKAISKLQKVCGLPMTGKTSTALMGHALNNCDDILYKYILEIIEFYHFIHSPYQAEWVLNYYRLLG